MLFALAAAVPPPKDEKLSRAKLREPPLPPIPSQRGLKCRGATRSSRCSASRSEATRPGEKEKKIPPSAASLRGWIAAGATAPAPFFLLMRNFKSRRAPMVPQHGVNIPKKFSVFPLTNTGKEL